MEIQKTLDEAIEKLTSLRVELMKIDKDWLEEEASKIDALLCKAHDQCALLNVDVSLAADIRNKLSPVKNLCAMLKNREVDPYMERNDKLNELVDSETEKSLKVAEWLSSL